MNTCRNRIGGAGIHACDDQIVKIVIPSEREGAAGELSANRGILGFMRYLECSTQAIA
jgi:hypothetical protein